MKQQGLFYLFVFFTFLSSFILNKSTYTMSLVNQKPNQNTSVKGRIQVWGELLNMVKEKPLLGHGPNKDYFYENKIYSESEYVMFLWRYGVIGLLAYVALLLYLFKIGYQNRFTAQGKFLLQTVVVMAITSLTNNPFSSREVLVLWGVIIGYFFYFKSRNIILNEG